MIALAAAFPDPWDIPGNWPRHVHQDRPIPRRPVENRRKTDCETVASL
jgi:hypothetical protein